MKNSTKHLLFFVSLLLLAAPSAQAAESLARLLVRYQQYGLPLPPKDAVLAIHDHGDVRVVNGANRSLVFVLCPATKEAGALCLVGTQEWRSDIGDTLTPMPIPPSAKEAEGTEPMWDSDDFETNVDFAMAIQCRSRGWDQLAEFLLKRSRKEFHSPANIEHLAWQYWRSEFARSRTGRGQVLARLKQLVNLRALGTAENRDLVKDMEATLRPSSAKAGTVEALIDSLVEYDGGTEPVLTLERKGFEAVPSLIAHMNDNRLTRQIHPRFNNFPPTHGRISRIVTGILEGIMGKSAESDDPEKEVNEWWQRVRGTAEEEYMVKNVLAAHRSAEWPNDVVLQVIAAKYERFLPGIYLTILRERPNMQSYPVADLLVESKLSREVKRAALLEGARHKRFEHRRAALFALKGLAYEEFLPALLDCLRNQPTTPSEPYWGSVGALAILVAESNSPEAWRALLDTARRVDVGTRMELIGVMNNHCVADTPLKPRIDFVKSFLDDHGVRDINSDRAKFGGPSPGFISDRIAVCDLAALRLAHLLDLSVDEDSAWTAADWKALRQRVRDELDRRRAK